MREVMFVDRDWRQIEGRWFTGGYDEVGLDVRLDRIGAGDAILVSGPVGDHGIAVMFAREQFGLRGDLQSDSAPLDGLVAAMLAAFRDIHVMRDPTRGGVTASLCEIAASAHVA